MFSRTRAPSLLDLEIDKVFRALNDHPMTSEEYGTILERVIKLHKMREEEKSPDVSKDTLALIGANLLGIILIIRHEHLNVIASRAMSLAIRPR